MRRFPASILFLVVPALVWAEPLRPDTFELAMSTGTTQHRRSGPQHLKEVVPEPIRRMPHQFQKRIKATSPNPNVQPPDPSPMPSSGASPMPEPQAQAETKNQTENFLNAVAKVMTRSWNGNIFVWLPALSTDPNTGPTFGLLPVLVLVDPIQHHIRHLLAPSITYNNLYGATATMRYYWYPTGASQLYTTGSYSQHTNRELKARYENAAAYEGVLFWKAEGYHRVKGSERFFGIGPATEESGETGYVSLDTTLRSAVGINFLRSWRASFGMRFRERNTGPNIIPNTADLKATYPGLVGLGPTTTVANEFRLLWDTRDLPITPSRGSSGEAFFEKTSLALGSDSDFFHYGLEGKQFFPWHNPRHVTVIHGLYEWANGTRIPFYELPSAGGRETLRGYGDGRFVDQGRMIFNLEHRITFASLGLMGIETQFQVAPFFDIGTVFPSVDRVRRQYFRPVYGAAFRAAVKPNVVGDVAVGIGKEGPAVFVDINYPF